jgi:PAS domain S-box-containing protein
VIKRPQHIRKLPQTILAVLEKQALVAKRIRAEKALVQSESLLRILVNTIPDLIWLKDQNGVYLSCNPMFERFFGAKESEIVGKTDYDFVDRDLADFFRANDRKAMAANKPSKNEEELTFADGGYRGLFETIKTPMFDSDGELIGVLGIARDITELRNAENEKLRLERQLKHSQKMESIGNLAGGIAHDFNNILSSVIGFSELALDDVEKGTNLEDSLQEVYAAGKRAKELVKQILAFARKSDEKMKPIEIGPIAGEVLKFIRSSIPTTIEIHQNIASNSLIMGNSTQIHQVFMNLCTNAAYAMEEVGGVLDVSLKDVFVDKENLSI